MPRGITLLIFVFVNVLIFQNSFTIHICTPVLCSLAVFGFYKNDILLCSFLTCFIRDSFLMSGYPWFIITNVYYSILLIYHNLSIVQSLYTWCGSRIFVFVTKDILVYVSWCTGARGFLDVAHRSGSEGYFLTHQCFLYFEIIWNSFSKSFY